MKKLTDVYIKVTKQNQEGLKTLLNRKIRVGYYIYFLSDDDSLSWLVPDIEENKQKVSLSQLKRLIETIPTREEIKRLKQQVSAYKTNYDKVVKHSLSKEDVIEELTTYNKWLEYEIEESGKKQKLLQNLYDNALKEIKELKKANSLYFKMSLKNIEENERLKNKKWYQIWK